ncbi:hypothetical protein SK128_026960, partial [Halocaridina rubra]
MEEETFLGMVKKLAIAIQSSPEKYRYVKSNCSNRMTYEGLFYFIWNFKDAQEMLTPSLINSVKSEESAESLRKEGNNYYKKQLDKALELYNRSIMESPHHVMRDVEMDENIGREERYLCPLIQPSRYGGIPDGEPTVGLAVGFANRSAVLFELKMYDQCIEDIELALKYGYPKEKQEKLENRRANCLLELKTCSSESTDSEVDNPKEKAVGEEQISTDTDFCEKLLSSMQISKDTDKSCKSMMKSYKVTYPPVPSEVNEDVPVLSSAVKVSSVPEKGRCLIAARDIAPGEILGVEEAQSICIEKDKLDLHCSTCLRLTINPLPCPGCTKIVFCNETCRLKGLSEDHWLECSILPTMLSLDMTKRNLVFKMLKSLSYNELSAFIRRLEREGKDNPEKDIFVSSSYKSVYNLCTNKDKLSFEFIFMQCQIAFVITKLLLQSGRFFLNSRAQPFEPTSEDIIKTGAVLLSHDIQLYCNPYQIYDLQIKDSVGAGVFPTLSLMNHSCYPSVRHYSCGRSLVCRAIRPIPDGEELTISYASEFQKQPRAERKPILDRYMFSCTCEACENNWRTFEDLPSLRLKCLECQTPIEGRLRLCQACVVKSTNKDSTSAVITVEQYEEIDKIWSGVLGASSLESNISNGVKMTQKDYSFICESLQLLYTRVVMPCQH